MCRRLIGLLLLVASAWTQQSSPAIPNLDLLVRNELSFIADSIKDTYETLSRSAESVTPEQFVQVNSILKQEAYKIVRSVRRTQAADANADADADLVNPRLAPELPPVSPSMAPYFRRLKVAVGLRSDIEDMLDSIKRVINNATATASDDDEYGVDPLDPLASFAEKASGFINLMTPPEQ